VATQRIVLTRPLCVLWRPDGALQLGLDGDHALVLPGAPAGTDAVIRALRVPRTPLEVARLVPLIPRASLDGILAALEGSGLLSIFGSRRPDPVTVIGTGALALGLFDLLDREGHTVRTGVRSVTDASGLVVVCGITAEPDRVLTRDLTAAGVPHLVVRAEPERAVIGPFVVPGRTACVACTDLVRRDLDSDWPHLLAQLCRTEHVPAPRQTAWAAATASAQLAAWRAGRGPETMSTTLELDAFTGALGVRQWPRHPDCGCVLAAVV